MKLFLRKGSVQPASSRLPGRNLILCSLLALTFLAATSTTAEGHSVFKRILQQEYSLSVSCNSCHVPDQARSMRNGLGGLFERQLSEFHLTEKFYSAQRRGFSARRASEEEMGREFLKALQNVDRWPTSDGRTFGQRFRSGDFDGMRLR